MDASLALKEVENSIRDFISYILSRDKGTDWISTCGVSQQRINHWVERKSIEEKKHKFGTAEGRLIYYSDFYDLLTILDKSWNNVFKDALGDKKEVDVFLKTLDMFRNTDAHRREALPHQKHLIIGIAGELRNRITLYRSRMETGEDYFPRIESARDNYGGSWVIGDHIITSKSVLRPGDWLTFVISATDPLGEQLEYCCLGNSKWSVSNIIEFEIENKHISKLTDFILCIRSKRDFHAYNSLDPKDDMIIFRYSILPKLQ
ncbi:Swt1 family HEPN domain-containing protein [Rufibacter roseus]|uniref:Swt1 family HEPN domain-containing protein n=1 Tax=Rufibacter roseus TaxID=1567108 RepID=A0ABW2DP74_9BACT|nr:Swt1 family HEPN domain-containing protein [Rufibacter roseus]